MTRFAFPAVAALFLLAAVGLAEFRHDDDLQIDKADTFKKGTYFKIQRVLEKNEVLVVGVSLGRGVIGSGADAIPGDIEEHRVFSPFILRIPSRGLITGRRIDPKGRYRVADTRSIGDKTLFVIEPAK